MIKASDFLIATDAGHHLTTAGKETPFISELGRKIKEYEFNEPVVRFLNEELERCGFRVLQVNSPDEDTPLVARTDKANYAKADILVSMHYNCQDEKFDDFNPEGLAVYIYPGSKEGRKLAESVLKYLPEGTTQKNNGIKEANFHMLRESNMPAILSENGFMDNPREAMLMLNEYYQREVAQEHAKGICDYFNVTYVAKEIDSNYEPVEKFVTHEELQNILKDYVKKEIITTKVVEPKTVMKYDSFIHYFETDKDMEIIVSLGERFKREIVSKIVNDNLDKGIILGINAGFFNKDPKSEHNTLLINEGLYYNPPSESTMDFIYYKSGLTEVKNIKTYNQAELSSLQQKAHWAIGSSYSLVQMGRINLENMDNFAHATSKQPRTMIGQRFDGTFVLVVCDGRTSVSKGLTAHEQAEFMMSLGCYNAVNLDGGGSSTMVYVRNGKPIIYNTLRDGVERAVGSVILVKMA